MKKLKTLYSKVGMFWVITILALAVTAYLNVEQPWEPDPGTTGSGQVDDRSPK